MPTLNLFTSIPVDPVISSDLLKDPTNAVAKIIGKPAFVRFIFDPGKGLAISYKSGSDPVSVDDILLQHGLAHQEVWKNEVDEMKKVIDTLETKHRHLPIEDLTEAGLIASKPSQRESLT
ncbi:hypothetical protein L1987_80044 [Smallanthus sonchifolius]|uniref:Uncharacterized protein n=1 Tax=Smallanthus sonchifolius TaxID=185202 RepID=A0ACB8YKV5_9ASTR|nr:hypothetical protein L1987_80044 [Smallanthus sonchifolius]